MASPPFLIRKEFMFDIETAILFLFITIPITIGALALILQCIDSKSNDEEGGK